MKTVIQFYRHASVDTTNVLSSYFMTVGMHRFAWSTVGTYHFRVGPNISEFLVGEVLCTRMHTTWKVHGENCS